MRSFGLSPPERFAIAVALAMLAMHAFGLAEALEYRRELLLVQPWRLFTAHLVHVNWPHVVINAAALWVVARLFASDLRTPAQAIVLVFSALATSSALWWLSPGLLWYRGLSGALHGLFFAGATTWLLTGRPRGVQQLWIPAALFIGGWIKVLTEQGAGSPPTADWLGAAVVPQAHLVGAACGTALGALFAAAKARREQQRAEQ